MKTLAELKALFDKTILSLDSAKAMLAEAKDDAAKALAQKAYDTTKAELTALENEITSRVTEDKAKAHIAAGLRDLEAMNAAVVPTSTNGKTIADAPVAPTPKVEAVPVDHEKALNEREELFNDWMGGKRLDGVAQSALQPKNQKLIEKAIEAGADQGMAVALPPRVWAKMIGAQVNTKAIPMVTGDGSSAGGRSYLFWPEYDAQLKKLPPEEPSLFMRVTKRASVNGTYTYTSLETDTNQYGSVAVSRGTEGSDANETEIEFKQASISTYPLNAYTEASKILLGRDRLGLEGELVQNFKNALENKINYEIMHGLGAGHEQCLGIRQDDDVILVARDVASQVCLDDLIDLESGVRVQLRRNASYCIADSVKAYLKKLKISATTDQRPLFTAGNTVGAGVLDRLNDYPWFVGTDMSTIGNNGDVIYGDFSQYTLAVEQEAVVSISDHFQFQKGLRCFRIDSMCGGRAIFPQAFVVLVHISGS